MGKYASLDEKGKLPSTSLPNEIRMKIGMVVGRYSEMMVNRIRNSMEASKHGKFYQLKGQPGHKASAPGEPPAVVTGALIRSIEARIYRGGMDAEIGSFTGVSYAFELEKGSKRVDARPYLKPALEYYEDRFVAAIRRVIEV